MRWTFTSESVTEGHPDKVCDRISDAVLDAVLTEDPKGRVACETFVTVGMVLVGGEITTTAWIDLPRLVRSALRDIGYVSSASGMSADGCSILNTIGRQSPDIAQGVDTGGAGDQGVMFGYACRETPELMPLPIVLAHRLAMKLAEVRKSGAVDWLYPDGKSQVTVEYDGRKPVRVDSVVLAAQHSEAVLDRTGNHITRDARARLVDAVIKSVVPSELVDRRTSFYINETGKFVTGGPQSDTGMTGRKLIVDTYGGRCPHGGGAFSGKDPSKVDRSATYMARYVAKNCVAAGLADELEIKLAYVIGRPEPTQVAVETHGTGKLSDEEIRRVILDVFDFTPRGMIAKLNLRRPMYVPTASYGHFGRHDTTGQGMNGETYRDLFTWEKLDMVAAVKKAAKV
jgi:S-adenosylmethionine synthetase